MSKTEKFLFQLIIFLIPTNLAYHFISTQNYLNGILVDYLIPKIYLSDIPIFLLIIIFITKSFKNLPKKPTKLSTNSFISISLLIILLIVGILSRNPTASIYYWITITKFIVFYLYLKHSLLKGLSFKDVLKIIRTPLILSLLTQSIIGIIQVITQKSIAGYLLLGETHLTLSSQIDKIHLKNLYLPHINSLVIPAYGTTPHNNVLAGFLSIGLIFLYLSTREKIKYKLYQSITLYITYILSLITLLLTFSGTAWLALFTGFSLIGLSHTTSKHQFRLIFRLFYPLIFILITFITIIPLKKIDNISIIRRQQLNQIAINMIKDNPLTGVGLNNFTTKMSAYGSVSSNTKFLQPTHNILFLWLSETGIIGLIILLLLYRKIDFKSLKIEYWSLIIPIILIGLLDHYPITLQTGQLLTVLSLSLTALNK